jgi:hypothetical protein
MPRGDRTGPLGEGPMTGRQWGYCAGYHNPGYGRGAGRGFGHSYFGHGRGRRFFWGRYATLPEDVKETSGFVDEMGILQNEVRNLKSTLETILSRLNKLEPKEKEK